MTNTTIELLDAWKGAKGITSDNQAGLALGVARQTVSGWRKNGRQAEAPIAARMARDLGRDELQTLAAIEAERAIDSETRRTWARLAGKALSVALCALGGLTAATLPARAYASSAAFSGRSADNLYLMFSRWLHRRRRTSSRVWNLSYRPATS